MINGEHHCASTAARQEPASDDHSTPATCQWLSSTTKYTASCVYDALRRIPNPTHFLFSAPGRVITLLALAGRGSGCGPYSGPAIPYLSPPTDEAAWMAELNNQYDLHSHDTETTKKSSRHPQDSEDILSRQKREPRGRGGGRGGSW